LGIDILDDTSNPSLMMKREGDIMVEVHLFTTENGGRNGPTPTKFFGCPAEIQGELFDCRLILGESARLAPGDTAVVPIMFLSPGIVLQMLKVGDEFRLWELRYIGTAKVLALSAGSDMKGA